MTKKAWIIFLLLVTLAGCNLPLATQEAPSSKTEVVQPATQTPGSTPAETKAPIEVQIIPGVPVQIEGAAYLAYQLPGDPFRFVCQEPCPLDPRYISAEYQGFRAAHSRMVEMLGIDTLAELQPVDMHLDFNDSICKSNPYGHAYIYNGVHQAYTCTDGPGIYPDLEEKIQKAALASEQYFPIHEYMHTLFFGRLSGTAGGYSDYKAEFFHDYVVPVPAFIVGTSDPATFCTQDASLAPGDYGGALIREFCQRNGFDIAYLKQSLIELDALYQSGGGKVPVAGYQHPAPTLAQYRDILNALLGSDTTPAFAAACWPPELFGMAYKSLPGCAGPVESGTPTPIP